MNDLILHCRSESTEKEKNKIRRDIFLIHGQMWYWYTSKRGEKTLSECKQRRTSLSDFIMPTLLEALEEKYGHAHNSDIEEAEMLVSIFVPKRPPRQRWLKNAFFIIITFQWISHCFENISFSFSLTLIHYDVRFLQ